MGDLADLSASRRVETVCPQCGTSSHVDFWEIVDVRARPELAELKTGRHFAVRCPSNHTYELNEPVIILGFASPPFVLFVPAQDTTDEEDEAAVRRLITGRREILRTIDMEDEDWFDSTSRLLLPLFITSPGVRALETAVIALLLADDAGSFGRVVGTHPVLLDDAAQEALLVLETAQRNVGDDAVADRFKALTELLSDVSREVQKSNAIQQPIIDAWERFSGSDDKSKALDAVVAAIRHALSSEDTSPNTRRSLMIQLGDALHLRHEFFSGERADLDEAIVVGEQAIALATEDEDRGSILGKLGRWLADRVELEESQSDLDAALSSLERSLSLVSKDNPDTARRHYDLGRCFGHRFRRSGASHDLDSAIENLRHAVDLTSDDNNDKAERLHALGNRLADRFKLSALQSDIDAAIAAAEDAFRIAGEDAYDTPRYVYGLGLHYSARSDAFHSATDLEAAIDAVEKAADLTPDYRSTKPMRLVMLGVLLVDRFRQTKQLTDVAAAVRVTEDAANLAADGHLDRHTVLASLGNRYGDRYDAGKLRSDLDASIATLEESLRLTPEEYDSASGRFNNLGYRLNQRFELTGALGDLNAAVSAGERSVALTLTGDPDRPQHLNTYSTCLGDRFLQLQSRADLANALAAAEEAVALAPDSHPRKPMFLNCLSNRVAQRYGLLGLPADLDAALNACERAVQLCPEDHEYRPTYLSNLNLCLAKRFDSRRAQADLDAATAAAEQALARTPKGHEDRSLCLSNLALRRIDYFELTGARSYLDAAIALTEEAIALTPEHHVDLPGRLNNLAAWLGEKFDLTSSKGDLDTAIIAAERALVLTPGDHIDRPSRLNNLSIRLLDRFELTASRADLDAAIDAAEQAVALTAHDDIDRAMRLIAALERGKVVRLRADISRAHRYPANLGPDQRDHYDGVRSRIKEIDSLLRGLDHLEPTQRPLSYNVDVSRLRKERQGLHEERLALEGGDPTFREAPLDYAGVRRLMSATNATSVYLQPIEDDEHGLLVVIVHADSPMDAPAPEDVLFVPGWHSAAVRELLFADWPQATGQDGASPSLSVPESAPIGWFTAYELWTRGAAGHADFPNVHLASLLDRIGREVMSPIARRLREVVVGRIILIPGDLLSVLPLHAAPIDEGGQPFGEAFETSYTSSATVLGHCATRPKIGTADEPSFIAIADPDSTLPFAAIEVRTVARLFPGRAKVAIGDEATWPWLARHVSAADYIALSSHAFFDLADSRMSWFQLASSHTPEADARPAGSSPPDGPRQQERWLRLDDIWANRLSLRPGSVVTAAVCETGWIDFQGFPDEHLGFPTAFLAAGASTAIASLWRVDDFSTALLMQEIYRGMIVERLPPCLAAGRASAWLRKLTKNEVISLIDELRQNTEQQREVCSAGELIYAQLAELDAKRDQIVGAQDLLPFAQPSYWAGFAVYGSC